MNLALLSLAGGFAPMVAGYFAAPLLFDGRSWRQRSGGVAIMAAGLSAAYGIWGFALNVL